VQEKLCAKIFGLFITEMLKYKRAHGRYPTRAKNIPVFEADFNLDSFLSTMRKTDFDRIVALEKAKYLALDPYNGERVLGYWENSREEGRIFLGMWNSNIKITRGLACCFLKNKSTVYFNRKLDPADKRTSPVDKDLIQELRIGMLAALRDYEWWRATAKFSSFCTTYMRNQALIYLAEERKENSNLSLDETVSDGEDGGTHKDLLPDQTPSEGITYEIETEMLVRAIERLEGKKGFVVSNFFGIGCEKMTLEEIGERMGVTRSRAQMLKEEALRRLREKMGLMDKFASYPVLTDTSD